MDYEPDDLPAPEPDVLDQDMFGLTTLREPDLATAFLAALDAVDDRCFVTPPPEALAAEPAPEPALETIPELAKQLAAQAATPQAGSLQVGSATEVPVASAPGGESGFEAEAASEVASEPAADVLEDLEEFVAFSLGDMRCVVPIRSVLEVGLIPDSAPVPNGPAWLHGLGNLRGQVLALIDLRAFFGLGRVKASTGRMVVLRAEAEEIRAGVLVDQVHPIIALSSSRFYGPPASVPEGSAPFVWGACDYGNYTMVGLDVDGVLGVESMTDETV